MSHLYIFIFKNLNYSSLCKGIKFYAKYEMNNSSVKIKISRPAIAWFFQIGLDQKYEKAKNILKL